MDESLNRDIRGPDLRRRSLVLRGATGIALPALGLGACATGSRPSGPVREFEQPRVTVGDRWHYREINRYNQLPLADVEVTVAASSPLVCSVRRRRTDTTAGEIARPDAVQVERYASPWVVDLEPIYDLTMDFAEPMPILPASLRVGENDARKTSYTVRGYSGQFRWDQRLKAIGTERITTPAGTFDCLLVRRMIWFQYPDVFRFNSARVDNAWYAPEVNRWVRREWTGDYHHENSLDQKTGMRRREDWVRWELVSYSPAAGGAG
ncbi:MAG: DUF3108 domain-containing protein [Lautropia sp.]|nr:DUF3108 domain-containing protein [Lautropia sp.]